MNVVCNSASSHAHKASTTLPRAEADQCATQTQRPPRGRRARDLASPARFRIAPHFFSFGVQLLPWARFSSSCSAAMHAATLFLYLQKSIYCFSKDGYTFRIYSYCRSWTLGKQKGVLYSEFLLLNLVHPSQDCDQGSFSTAAVCGWKVNVGLASLFPIDRGRTSQLKSNRMVRTDL